MAFAILVWAREIERLGGLVWRMSSSIHKIFIKIQTTSVCAGSFHLMAALSMAGMRSSWKRGDGGLETLERGDIARSDDM